MITLTLGGNDVGFGSIMKACVLNLDSSCGNWSTKNRHKLKEYIEDKRDKLEDLYSRLYADSGYQAKIYVLGYPKFISDDFASHCSPNPASVSSAEREFIGHSIEYMNNVIESAAKKAGVAYGDTEDNLRSHRLVMMMIVMLRV